MKVLSFGSLNIDHVYHVDHIVQKGETLSVLSVESFPGGKGLNQSIALAKAGAHVFHAGSVGEDGRALLSLLKESGVDTSCVTVGDVPTGNTVIQVDSAGNNCILLFGGANQTISEPQVDAALSRFEEGDCLLLQNEINALPYIIEKAAERKMRIILNPSPMDDKIRALPLDKVDCFIMNEIEAAQILETEATGADELISGLSKRFPDVEVVLTLGESGSVYLRAGRVIRQSAYRVKAVDTTAAGDTFTGYFVASILRGDKPEDAMRLAAKASAIAVTRQGAAPSIPTRAEVDAFEM